MEDEAQLSSSSDLQAVATSEANEAGRENSRQGFENGHRSSSSSKEAQAAAATGVSQPNQSLGSDSMPGLESESSLNSLFRRTQADALPEVSGSVYETARHDLGHNSEERPSSSSLPGEAQATATPAQPNSCSLGSDLERSLQIGPGSSSLPSEAHPTGSLVKPDPLTSQPPATTNNESDQPAVPNTSGQRNAFSSRQSASAGHSKGPSALPRPASRRPASQGSQMSVGISEREALVKHNLHLAQEAENVGDYTKAQDKYNRALKIQMRMPKDPCKCIQITRMVARCSVKLGKVFNAIEVLMDNLREFPMTEYFPNLHIEYIQVHFMLALSYRQIEQCEQEISNLETVLRMISDESNLANELGGMIHRHLYLALMRDGQSVEARSHLDIAQTGAGGSIGENIRLLTAIEEVFPPEEPGQIPGTSESGTTRTPGTFEAVPPESAFPTLPHVEQEALISVISNGERDQTSVQGFSTLAHTEQEALNADMTNDERDQASIQGAMQAPHTVEAAPPESGFPTLEHREQEALISYMTNDGRGQANVQGAMQALRTVEAISPESGFPTLAHAEQEALISDVPNNEGDQVSVQRRAEHPADASDFSSAFLN